MTRRAVEQFAKLTPGFDERLEQTQQVLRDTAAAHAGKAVLTTSLGAEDMVLTDLIARHHLPIALATLDTGRLHPQTLDLIPVIQQRYGLGVERWQPQGGQVVQMVQQHGLDLMYLGTDLRKLCCGVRKVEPLGRLLQGRTAWITGLRRGQSAARTEVPVTDTDGEGRLKVNPLAAWSWSDVWHCIERFDVPYNALHDQDFPSIGCEPCTRAILPGEDQRAGRWWWEQSSARECGLHVGPDGRLQRSASPPVAPVSAPFDPA